MSRLKSSAAATVVFVGLAGSAEGLRQTAYPDPGTRGKPWTVCYGHTGDVVPGQVRTVPECRALLAADAELAALGVDRCVKVAMPDARYVALVDLFFNVGAGTGCKSSVVRLINEGRTREGCDALLKYNRAAGIVLPGLTRRRQRERLFCLEGL